MQCRFNEIRNCKWGHLADVLHKAGCAILVQQRLSNRHRAGGVQHVHHGPTVLGDQLHCRVHLAGGGTTDQQWKLQLALLHALCHSHLQHNTNLAMFEALDG